MGGFVSDVVGGVGDAVSGVTSGLGDAVSSGVDLYKKVQAPIFDNAALIGTGVGAYMGGPMGARIGGMLGGAVQGQLGGSGNNIFGGGSVGTNASNYGSILQGGLGLAGGVYQGKVSKEAVQAAQQQALAGGQTAANMAAFRPIGTTSRFGSSNYQIDPTTGQVTGFGYNPSSLSSGYQNQLAGMTNQGLAQGQQQQALASQYLGSQQGQPLTALGQSYLSASPEQARQRYIEQQNAANAPAQEQALANIRNNLFQTGRTGLATNATKAGDLAATNPEMAAYYNSLANQQRQISAGADQAAQQQQQFGANLLSSGLGLTQQGQQFGQQLGAAAFSPFNAGFGSQYSVEQAAQQPLSLSTDLAKMQMASGNAQAGFYNTGAQNAARFGLSPELQYSATANVLNGLASPTSGIGNIFGNAVGGMLGSLGGAGSGGGSYDWSGLGSTDQWWL